MGIMSFFISHLVLKPAFYRVWNLKKDSFAIPMSLDSIISKFECGRHADFLKLTEKFYSSEQIITASFISVCGTSRKKKKPKKTIKLKNLN